MKYIICGLEHVGVRIAETLLDLKNEVTVITLNKNESSVFLIRDRVTNYVEGDARSIETLKLAGIDKADYVLIFTSNEIKNIEINCKVKELNPQAKTALLIKHLSYAKIVEQGFDVNCVFHLPSMVSLPIVSACIHKNILHTLKGGDGNYYFGHINSVEYPFLGNKTIKEIEEAYGIKVISYIAGIEQPFCEITENLVVKEGSLIYLTTREKHFEHHDFIIRHKHHSGLITDSSSPISFLKKLSIPAGIRNVIVLYLMLISVSIFIFSAFSGFSIINALYFVITTTSTVGYGDFNLQNAPFWIKLYGCFVMLAGAALLATLFSVITDNIISKRLGGYVGLYNRKIKDHVIVAGMGSIGLDVVRHLIKMGVKILVIEKNPENPNIPLLRNKIPVLIGDSSEQKILIKAGIKQAKTLAALIDNDLNNINIILKGNSLKSDLNTVARIFSHELHKKSATTFQIDNVISVSSIAVPYIICHLIEKNIIWAGYLNGNIYALYSLYLLNIPAFIGLNKRLLMQSYNICAVLVERNHDLHPVGDETIFAENDHVFVFSDYEALKGVERDVPM